MWIFLPSSVIDNWWAVFSVKTRLKINADIPLQQGATHSWGTTSRLLSFWGTTSTSSRDIVSASTRLAKWYVRYSWYTTRLSTFGPICWAQLSFSSSFSRASPMRWKSPIFWGRHSSTTQYCPANRQLSPKGRWKICRTYASCSIKIWRRARRHSSAQLCQQMEKIRLRDRSHKKWFMTTQCRRGRF